MIKFCFHCVGLHPRQERKSRSTLFRVRCKIPHSNTPSSEERERGLQSTKRNRDGPATHGSGRCISLLLLLIARYGRGGGVGRGLGVGATLGVGVGLGVDVELAVAVAVAVAVGEAVGVGVGVAPPPGKG